MYGFNYLENFLKDEGFRYQNEDTFISFRYQGSTFIAFKNESPFLSILKIIDTNGKNRSSLLDICNQLNDDSFVLKYTVKDNSDNDVWITYEFIPKETTSSDDFDKILAMLEIGTRKFFEKV